MARAPYDRSHTGSQCVEFAFGAAAEHAPDDHRLAAEIAVFRLASADAAVRRAALVEFDARVDSLMRHGAQPAAVEAFGSFALGIWTRSQRLLARPVSIRLHPLEEAARKLHTTGAVLRRIPPPPPTRSPIGASEALWSAQLFDRAATWSTGAARSRWLRLALAPWVVMEQWTSLDSAARALLIIAPRDSAVMPALGVAALHQVKQPVADYPRVMMLLDSALSAMPPVDSARHDSFDDVLTRSDDDWRYGYLPTDRLQIDARGWLLVDPLWSTPINELRLTRMARIAEADMRYADLARPSESGSETIPGRIFVRRGAPDSRWQESVVRFDPRLGSTRRVRQRPSGSARTPTISLQRGWPRLDRGRVLERSPTLWRIFSGEEMSISRAAVSIIPDEARSGGADPTFMTALRCAESSPAEWAGVPFVGTLDTIDVTIARFRASADSVDIYLGARLPLRQFARAKAAGTRSTDRIRFGAFLSTSAGRMLFRGMDERPLPHTNEQQWNGQWSSRVRTGEALHRVEAFDPLRAVGARGVALYTSDDAIAFSTGGFGMSEVLVGASIRERTVPVTRWSDLEVIPNGAVSTAGTRFGVAWEIYELAPEPDGLVRWKVEMRRERSDVVRRADVRAALRGDPVASQRVTADEADASSLAFTRVAPASGVVVDHLLFALPANSPPGRHVIEVKITDLVSGREIRKSVGVRLLFVR